MWSMRTGNRLDLTIETTPCHQMQVARLFTSARLFPHLITWFLLPDGVDAPVTVESISILSYLLYGPLSFQNNDLGWTGRQRWHGETFSFKHCSALVRCNRIGWGLDRRNIHQFHHQAHGPSKVQINTGVQVMSKICALRNFGNRNESAGGAGEQDSLS